MRIFEATYNFLPRKFNLDERLQGANRKIPVIRPERNEVKRECNEVRSKLAGERFEEVGVVSLQWLQKRKIYKCQFVPI